MQQWQTEQHIILFDGVCNLCNAAVQFVIKNDRKKLFKFASLQSEIGKSIVAESTINTADTDSFVLYSNGHYYTHSTAALMVLKTLGGTWKVLYAFIIVPKFLRNAIYKFVAANRYRIFGRKDECLMPTNDLQARFLN